MKTKAYYSAGAASLLLLAAVSAYHVFAGSAPACQGTVVAVADGDTLTILTGDRQQVKIRLAQIDAPEKRQDYGQRSKQSLSSLVYGKAVQVEVFDTDRYGRTVGKVWRDGADVNLEQVKLGMAWVYRQYARDRAYFSAEDSARSGKVGLWGSPTQPRRGITGVSGKPGRQWLFSKREMRMGLEKAIKSGKERRKPYYRSKQFDMSCRGHGGCPACRGNRMHKHGRRAPMTDDGVERG